MKHFVLGILCEFTGLSSMTIPMYIAESAPAEVRGRLVSVNVVMIAGGQFVSNVIAGIFSFVDEGWRYSDNINQLCRVHTLQ